MLMARVRLSEKEKLIEAYRVMDMRIEGFTLREIGEVLAPYDYKNKQQWAWTLIQFAYKKIKSSAPEKLDELRELQNLRCEKLSRAALKTAITPGGVLSDPEAGRLALSIANHQAKLNGLFIQTENAFSVNPVTIIMPGMPVETTDAPAQEVSDE